MQSVEPLGRGGGLTVESLRGTAERGGKENKAKIGVDTVN